MSQDINSILFIYYGVAIPVIAIFGFIGNVFVLYILLRYVLCLNYPKSLILKVSHIYISYKFEFFKSMTSFLSIAYPFFQNKKKRSWKQCFFWIYVQLHESAFVGRFSIPFCYTSGILIIPCRTSYYKILLY